MPRDPKQTPSPPRIEALEACLPAELRGPATTITPIAAGLSGAGVYRVEASEQVFVLKISPEDEPLARFRRKLHVQQLASRAGVAPRIVHANEDQRAIVSAFVADRSFVAFFRNPQTHEAAIVQLGRTLRRVHELALEPDAESTHPREFLTAAWSGVAADFTLPPFAYDAVRRVLAERPPPNERKPVLSHNDVNPMNLAYDGENILLLDWDTAGPNDHLYDLAAIAMFLRMDEQTCRKLLAAYDGEPVDAVPARFAYNRRLVAVLCGTIFLQLARQAGHAGGADTLDETISLADFYQRMRTGSLSVATAEGRWRFGLALIKESFSV